MSRPPGCQTAQPPPRPPDKPVTVRHRSHRGRQRRARGDLAAGLHRRTGRPSAAGERYDQDRFGAAARPGPQLDGAAEFAGGEGTDDLEAEAFAAVEVEAVRQALAAVGDGYVELLAEPVRGDHHLAAEAGLVGVFD